MERRVGPQHDRFYARGKDRNRDRFWLELPVIDQPASGLVEFSFDPEGRVESVLLRAFDAGEIGRFTKVR